MAALIAAPHCYFAIATIFLWEAAHCFLLIVGFWTIRKAREAAAAARSGMGEYCFQS